jgi:hypothetical protein
MSKRRQPGEIVKRLAGSGFIESAEPSLIKIPEGKAYEFPWKRNVANDGWDTNEGGEADYCMLDCGDTECREWANLEIISGPHKGEYIYHVSECEMEDSK